VSPSRALAGEITPAGDKSISHRAVILGAIAEGDTQVTGFLQGEDTLNTARALAAMGVRIDGLGTPEMRVHGVGLRGLQPPPNQLDMGNSGTGLRLLMGVLAGQGFSTTLVGDASLSKRPMDRIAVPLGQMGIRVEGQGEKCAPPVTVHGGKPRPIEYHSLVASAQVKSAVLLAGLYAGGTTRVVEPALSRDHTERMLAAFGADVSREGCEVSVSGVARLSGRLVNVPGDTSSAAYFIAAAVLCDVAQVVVHNTLLNPTRTGLLTVLDRMGADITRENETSQTGETVGSIRARTSALRATRIAGDEIPSLIDELPLLAVLATQADGSTEIRDAAELRVKESDRLAVTARCLEAMGATVEELPDGMIIHGPTELRNATLDSQGDHRIAMSFAVAGLIADGETTIGGAEYVHTSFPGFVQAMRSIGADVEEAQS